MNEALKRSAYIQRIRRSFLLRVHPDRFRAQSDHLRKGQADILKAFTDRLAAPDFVQYVSCNASSHHPTFFHQPNQTYHYYLESEKSGLLEKYSINLDQGVSAILNSIYQALRSSGLQNMTPPPPPPPSPHRPTYDCINKKATLKDEINKSSSINHSFDINTNKNRNLLSFLRHNMDLKEVQERKVQRLDAQTAALVARQLFHFSSIDGTRVGWSSSSLAKSLSTLANLYDHHHHKFQVNSFYPFRLLIANHDSYEHRVDLFGGGNITLHPAATPIQWLDTLLSVTPDDLQHVRKYQDQEYQYITRIQNTLSLLIRKGHTCPSYLYYKFLKNLNQGLGDLDYSSTHPITLFSSNISTKSLIHLILEDDPEDLYVRDEANITPIRARISPSGHIHISIRGMLPEDSKYTNPTSTLSSLLTCLDQYREKAQMKRNEQAQKEEEFKDRVQSLRAHFGLSRVYKVVPSLVTMDQLMNATQRLLEMDESSRTIFKSYLAGQSLGITGSGPSCHLGDDGSIIVPWDWL